MNIMVQRNNFFTSNGTVELIYRTDCFQYYIGVGKEWRDRYNIELETAVIFQFRNSKIGTEIDGYTLIAKWED